MSPRDVATRAASASTSAVGFIGVALMPKCPVCVAAALSAIGVGASIGAWLAPIARPLGIAVALIALAVFVRGEWQRRRQRSVAAACGCASADDGA
jgi:hypothetical protein